MITRLDEKDSILLSELNKIVHSLVYNIDCPSPVAFNKVGKGQIENFRIAKYDDLIAATLRAVETFSLEVKERRGEEDQTFFRFYDAKKERIDLFIECRSDTMTSIKFDVG